MRVKINQHANPLTHNPKVIGSNPIPATKQIRKPIVYQGVFCFLQFFGILIVLLAPYLSDDHEKTSQRPSF
jgi:hypothetical protein